MAALTSDSLLSRLPIIVILGATGTGKSKLGLQIAKQFNGEIINADSMQVYKGLDIVTNKVTGEEKRQAKHHLLDFLNPNQHYSVVHFRDNALPIIDDLLGRRKLPVIVGGTNYYIESLIWKVLIQDKWAERNVSVSERDSGKRVLDIDSDDDDGGEKRVKCDNETVKVSAYPEGVGSDASRLHEQLKKVDPERAAELHPNNKRKIMRSLEVYQQTGRKHSDLLKEQREAGGSQLGGPLRYPNALIFWIQSNQRILDARLDARIDAMIKEGLIEELLNFHSQYNKLRMKDDQPPDYTKGIFQSIGFKEFHEYLMLDEESRKSENGTKLFNEGVEAMKCVTKQYSRRQIKWIRNRLLGRPEGQAPPVYGLDISDVSLWEEKVYKPAIHVITCFMSNTSCDILPLPMKKRDILDPSGLSGHFFCNACERTFVGSIQWKGHLVSKKHQRGIRRKMKETIMKIQEEENKIS